jgi:hypothetical protein
VPAYLALLVADRRVAKALVLLALVTNTIMMIIGAAHTGRFGAERLASLPATCTVVIVGASIVHLSLGRFRRALWWSHALALLVVTVLALRMVSLLDYLQYGPVEERAVLITLGLLETGVLLAVGAPLALLTARALRRLPPEPAGVAAWSSRSDRSLS